MAASYYRAGSSVSQHLAELYRRYGTHVYRASYFIADPPSKSQGVYSPWRGAEGYPETIGGVQVTAVRDLGTGLDTRQADGKAILPWTPGDMMVTFWTEGGGSLTLRASATEPKLKYYLEVVGDDAEVAGKLADRLEAAVEGELVQPGKHGLKPRPLN